MKKTSSSVYNINYHIVWCPKYRKPVLVDKIKEFLADQIQTDYSCNQELGVISWNFRSCQTTYRHLFISTPPTESPVGIVKVLKGVTGLIRLFNQEIS